MLKDWYDAWARQIVQRLQAEIRLTLEMQSTCGRGLAPDGGGSASTCIDGSTAIGSKLPPTGFGVMFKGVRYFWVPSSCCRFACVMFAPAGTLRVSHTLPPMVEPLPMVIRPRIVAPA